MLSPLAETPPSGLNLCDLLPDQKRVNHFGRGALFTWLGFPGVQFLLEVEPNQNPSGARRTSHYPHIEQDTRGTHTGNAVVAAAAPPPCSWEAHLQHCRQ